MRANLNEIIEDVTSDANRLDELVPLYGKNKAEENRLKKITEAQNSEIKQLLAEHGVTEHTAGGYTVTVSTTEKFSFNMPKLIETIKLDKSLASKVIKTQEYVDMDALENLIYSGKVDTEMLLDMDKCRDVTKTVTLRVKKASKKKEKKNESDNKDSSQQ